MISGRRTVLAAVLVCLSGTACSPGPDPIGLEVRSLEERTVPVGGRLASAYPLERDGKTARASWQIETRMAWDQYAPWVEARLPDYRVVRREGMSLWLARSLTGDTCQLVLTFKPAGAAATIEASFEARPF